MTKRIIASIGGLLASALCALSADMEASVTSENSKAPFTMESNFQHSRWEAKVDTGVMFSPFIAENNRPVVNYTITAVQLGYMLNSPNDAGWLRGNYELVSELFGSSIFEGRGSYIVGTTLWLRYNFIPHDWKVVPYAQLGAGAVSTDVDRRLQGQNFNFNLEVGLGLRYFLTSRCSVSLEYRYQHISNANLAGKNLGINAEGAMVGVSWFF